MIDGQCNAVEKNGERCKRKAILQEEYKGQYEDDIENQWKYKLCSKHGETCRKSYKEYKDKCEEAKSILCNPNFDPISIKDIQQASAFKQRFLEANKLYSQCARMREDHTNKCVYKDFQDKGHQDEIESMKFTGSVCLDNYKKVQIREKELAEQLKIRQQELLKKRLEAEKLERKQKELEKKKRIKQEDILLDTSAKIREEEEKFLTDYQRIKIKKKYNKPQSSQAINKITQLLRSVDWVFILEYLLEDDRYEDIRIDSYYLYKKSMRSDFHKFIYNNMSDKEINQMIEYINDQEYSLSSDMLDYKYGTIDKDRYKEIIFQGDKMTSKKKLDECTLIMDILSSNYIGKDDNYLFKKIDYILDSIDLGLYDILKDEVEQNGMMYVLQNYFDEDKIGYLYDMFFYMYMLDPEKSILNDLFPELIKKYDGIMNVVCSINYIYYMKGIIDKYDLPEVISIYKDKELLYQIIKDNKLRYLCDYSVAMYISGKMDRDTALEKISDSIEKMDKKLRETMIERIIKLDKVKFIKEINPDKYEMLKKLKDEDKLRKYYGIKELLAILMMD